MNGNEKENFPEYKEIQSGKILGSEGGFFLAKPNSSSTYKLFCKRLFFY